MWVRERELALFRPFSSPEFHDFMAVIPSPPRHISVEKLLGRASVDIDPSPVSAHLRGQVVLVTGAGGSIGAELCRQIAQFRPAAIVAIDIAESPLFHLELEIARSFPAVSLHPEIGNIRDRRRLEEIFERHRPAIVFHAAAYKHVPLMESHIFEAVENNVFGTINVAEAGRRHRASSFVMISSDKAVRPSSVVGATKRLAELLLGTLQPARGAYVSVRFGNVLGSSGSVLTVFQDQIAHGGPVTVTHPEMRRYFMSIREAGQLVLQASAMAAYTEDTTDHPADLASRIFVLKMGDPVSILDLARNLIRLSGLRPDYDIPIVFTAPRPGEKLREELSGEFETLLPTSHPRIDVIAAVNAPPNLDRALSRLRAACDARDTDQLLSALQQAVPGYAPGNLSYSCASASICG
jgi:FlaA1/EpsC-like NDP-sugar epimerase